MTRIGLDLLFLAPSETGGMETYARSLVPRLPEAMPEARFVALAGRELAEQWRSDPWHPEIALIDTRVSSRTRFMRTVWEQTLVPARSRSAGLNLLHSLSQSAPAVAPVPLVVTIHDLIYETHPESSGALMNFGLRFLVPAAARSATRIITPSNATAEAVRQSLNVSPEVIDVVPEGPGRPVSEPEPGAEGRMREELGLGEGPLILCVSPRRPHKNLGRLVRAMAGVPDATLVLPGYPTGFDEELIADARAAGVQGRVRMVGWVDDDQLEALYRAATCAVFPSLAEGFGLPVLEAMRRGVPVAVSAVPVLEEVAGDATLFFDPLSTESIGDALRQLLGDPQLRVRLEALGLERASQFSWEQAAEGTVASYRRALATQRPDERH